MDRFTDGSLASSMDSALAKIRAVLPPDHQDHVARLEKRMSLPNNPQKNQPASLFLIQKALADRTLLRISYRVSGAVEALRREIEPLGLTYYGDRWHLIAWCRLRKDYRDFRTDRIEGISPSSEQFKPHEEFSLTDFIRHWDNQAVSSRGTIRADPIAAERIRKEAPFKLLQEERTHEGVTFTIEGGNWNWYIGWLLSFGDRIAILQPEELRNLVCETARATVKHHESIRPVDGPGHARESQAQQ